MHGEDVLVEIIQMTMSLIGKTTHQMRNDYKKIIVSATDEELSIDYYSMYGGHKFTFTTEKMKRRK